MEKRPRRRTWKRWLTLVATISWIGCGVGCQTVIPRKLDATRTIILANERGFEDAYSASPEAKAFVHSLMEQIIDYEYELEKASLGE
tara:strand:- start:311 stop:571 length:261 start_codon:yes stop_codon:yes gene_type:complete